MSILINLLRQLQVNDTLFYMLGIFLFSYLVLSQLALKKLSAHLIERDRRIEGREEESHKIKEQLSENQQLLGDALKKAQGEASLAFANIKRDAVSEQRGIINAAREASSAELKKIRAIVTEQMNQELKKIDGEIPKLARQVLDQILEIKSSSAPRSSSIGTEA